VYSSQYHCNFEEDVGKRRIFRLTLLVLINYVNFHRDIVIYELCDSLVHLDRAVKMDTLLQKRKQTCFLNTESK
jgi:hypothetical protein